MREKDLGIWQTWTWRRMRDDVQALAGGLASPGGATEIGRGLLTVEKTVIRFRPKQTVPAERVSRINTKNGNTKRTSARTTDKVDGFASSAKMHRYPNTRTRSASRRGFFDARARRAGHAESVPVRFARRRLTAGPTPVVLLRTGQF